MLPLKSFYIDLRMFRCLYLKARYSGGILFSAVCVVYYLCLMTLNCISAGCILLHTEERKNGVETIFTQKSPVHLSS